VKAAVRGCPSSDLKGEGTAVTTRTKRPPKRPRVQAPQRRVQQRRTGRRWPWAAGAAVLAVAAIAAAVIAAGGGDGGPTGAPEASGLPATPDYHSLLVTPNDPNSLLLGTHEGLFRSADGGRTWESATLAGRDAMNLARANGTVVWAAGHEVLAKSTDDGTTWQDVRPDGLPGLDVHGFAVDPRDPRTLYAAIAGQGLFRSTDGGASFSVVSREVGAGVMALAVTRDGRILAGDMQQGVFTSGDGGKTWKPTLQAGLMGLAVNPKDPKRVVATGPGILLSTDGGRNWQEVLPLSQGAGPVAWASSKPRVGYVVGFDKTLYKTGDGGATWRLVS
jgi:photosystem II stability/assembly factor-like uncharacterized protein